MNNHVFFPDYKNSILGIPNSILSYYGAKTHHATLPVLDEKLSKGYRNIVLLVLDGMGVDILNTHFKDGFLAENCVAELSSVYPCTTTSALTTLESGLTPIEHGWLGWSSYFKEVDECVDLFTGNISGTERASKNSGIAWQVLAYKNLFEQVKEADSSVECCRVSSFGEYKTKTNEEVCNHIEKLCQKDGRKYIYAYHFHPDRDIHKYGRNDERVKADIVLFDRQIEHLSRKLTDTLLIVTADHGLTDSEELLIENFPEIGECLAKRLCREARSISFFIKPEFMDIFPKRWESEFGNDFILMTGQEALEKGFFGSGKPHNRVKDLIGDYVAIATGTRSLRSRNEKGEAKNFKADHAGLRREEMIVPLILIER
ncbi:MAG: alkaline phosphatase family protein [Oscillospiraceae bacterium]|nr:alkaline phosphatase family protein [Oscillospiraceae bacterium]